MCNMIYLHKKSLLMMIRGFLFALIFALPFSNLEVKERMPSLKDGMFLFRTAY